MTTLKFPLVDLSNIQVGDKFIRMMGHPNGVPMEMIVTELKDSVIYALPRYVATSSIWMERFGDERYKFDQKTGIEIDEDLGWGPETGQAGTFIKEIV